MSAFYRGRRFTIDSLVPVGVRGFMLTKWLGVIWVPSVGPHGRYYNPALDAMVSGPRPFMIRFYVGVWTWGFALPTYAHV